MFSYCACIFIYVIDVFDTGCMLKEIMIEKDLTIKKEIRQVMLNAMWPQRVVWDQVF